MSGRLVARSAWRCWRARCSSTAAASGSPRLGRRQDRRGGRGERVRGRHPAGRREVRPGQRHHEQPEHRPAHLRGERRRSPSWSARPSSWCRTASATTTFMNTIENAVPDSVAQGHRGAEPARPAGQHPEPAPVVQAGHHARRRRTRSPPTWPPSSPLTPRTSRPTRAAFVSSLAAWNNAMAAFKAKYPNTPVATTEPVADYMLQAAGADNLTPFAFQADIMNGTDPSAQDVAVRAEPVHAAQGEGVCLQSAGDGLADRIVHHAGAGERHPGGGRLRDDADARLRLPVVDAGRGPGPAARPWPSKVSTEHL